MPASNRSAELIAIPLIERATHAVAVHLASHSDLAVTQAEAHVLAYLHGRRGTSIQSIHHAFGHGRSTLTSVLDRLEGRSLLTRSTDPENRRSVIVTLTRTGSALAKRVFETLSTFERQTLQKYSAAEIEVFRRVIAAFSTAT